MKVYIWESVSKLTSNYHSDGGLVVIAENLTEAMEAASERGVEFDGEDPYIVLNVTGQVEPEVLIFPDAGCC